MFYWNIPWSTHTYVEIGCSVGRWMGIISNIFKVKIIGIKINNRYWVKSLQCATETIGRTMLPKCIKYAFKTLPK